MIETPCAYGLFSILKRNKKSLFKNVRSKVLKINIDFKHEKVLKDVSNPNDKSRLP